MKPKKSKKKVASQGMPGLFGVTAKKPEPDTKPVNKAQSKAMREKRLQNVRI